MNTPPDNHFDDDKPLWSPSPEDGGGEWTPDSSEESEDREPEMGLPADDLQPSEMAPEAPAEIPPEIDRSRLGEQAMGFVQEAEEKTQQLREDLAEGDKTVDALEKQDDRTNQLAWKLAQGEEMLGRAQDEIKKRDEVIERLATHIRTLNAQVEKMKTEGAGGGSGRSTRSIEYRQHRRKRWGQIRRALKARVKRIKKAEAEIIQRAKQLQTLKAQQVKVEETKTKLVEAEKIMVRRWARAGAGARLCFILVTMAIMAIGSGIGVMVYHPAIYSAAATIQAKPHPGFPMTPEQLETWTTIHQGLLTSDSVVKAAADRLRQQGIEDYTEPEVLAAFFKDHLSFTSPSPGTVDVQLSARGADQTKRLLDTLAAAVISGANADRGRRTDRAQTILTVPATVNLIPVKDDRPMYAGIVFGGLFLFGSVLWSLFYRRLMTVARAVQADRSLFETVVDNDRWQEIQAQRARAYEEHNFDEM